MIDIVVLGTDTDAGKTTFSLLWLSLFGDQFAYWKPVETGDSDSEKIRRIVPSATVHQPLLSLKEPVAPALAAKRAGLTISSAADIADAKPASDAPLLIETFGGPLSPLNEHELQSELIHRLNRPAVLVASSAIGAITRTLTTLRVLRSEQVDVRCVILLGATIDDYAAEEIERFGSIPVISLRIPANWDVQGIHTAANEQRTSLERCRDLLNVSPAMPEASLVDRDRRVVWHPYTSLRDPQSPLPIAAAHDEFLHLADGRQLIDGISSWWTILHGHRHPRLIDALRRATDQIDHVLFAGATHPFAIECAETLIKTVPWTGGRVFFSDNGSTAVEVALKMAYQYCGHRGEPGRTLFVGLEHGYHGDTFGAMAISRDPIFFGRFEPLLFRTERIAIDADRLDEFLASRASETAAVIVEPLVQGAGGMRIYSPDTLRDMHNVARRYGVLFIVDEVMTAGRTGTFWAHSQAGIVPDLICAAKTLAGGVLSLAATLASPEIVGAFDTADRSKTFFHGHSFTAHPLACAVAVENLRVLAEGTWLQHVQRINDRWMKAIDELRSISGVQDVRVCGTILTVEVDAEGGYLAGIGQRWREIAIAHGVLLRPLGNVLYAMPPLCTTDDSLDRIAEAMRQVLNS